MSRAAFGPGLALAMACAVTFAAQRGASPDAAFEVASVKANNRGERMIRIDTEGRRFVATNVPVRSLIRLAYDLEDFQISGGPSWIDDDRFDVLASAERDMPAMGGPFTASAEVRAMVRALLAERFGLVARTETRELPIFALTLAREDGQLGPELTRSSMDCAALTASRTPDAGPPPCGVRMSPGSVVLEGVPIAQLAALLQGFVGRRIVDDTGLTGTYDLQLHWQGPSPGADAQQGVSLFTALREQAGLKLENTRGPVPVLVIDKVTRPTPN